MLGAPARGIHMAFPMHGSKALWDNAQSGMVLVLIESGLPSVPGASTGGPPWQFGK
ncbi:D-xylose ABC transporter, ATPase subunit [Desulfovibrio ferrophilus]|uniref:D-xylose ABC transporter, ATPase subunit n=1 Tax=Desulfovibrio ferrophilus TaxID=241368 RepID=A0A2Z6B334_9BACT|nr:D-xylose ABC transporter, ATPase subunit [Desulfovibrio ferrophilus]